MSLKGRGSKLMYASPAIQVVQPALGFKAELLQEKFANRGNKRARAGVERTGHAFETESVHRASTPSQAASVQVPSHFRAHPDVENRAKRMRQIPQQSENQEMQAGQGLPEVRAPAQAEDLKDDDTCEDMKSCSKTGHLYSGKVGTAEHARYVKRNVQSMALVKLLKGRSAEDTALAFQEKQKSLTASKKLVSEETWRRQYLPNPSWFKKQEQQQQEERLCSGASEPEWAWLDGKTMWAAGMLASTPHAKGGLSILNKQNLQDFWEASPGSTEESMLRAVLECDVQEAMERLYHTYDSATTQTLPSDEQHQQGMNQGQPLLPPQPTQKPPASQQQQQQQQGEGSLKGAEQQELLQQRQQQQAAPSLHPQATDDHAQSQQFGTQSPDEEALEDLDSSLDMFDDSMVTGCPDRCQPLSTLAQEDRWRAFVELGEGSMSVGNYKDAAFKFCQAARACRRTGRGDYKRCLHKAAAAYYLYAKLLEQQGQTWPSLAAASCCLERAQQAGSRRYTMWSAEMCADIHCKRAIQHDRPTEYLPALEMLELCLKQALGGIPPGVSVASLERLLCQCAWVLHGVSLLYCALRPSVPWPGNKAVEHVMEEVAKVVSHAKAQALSDAAASSQSVTAKLSALHQVAPVKAEPQVQAAAVKQEPQVQAAAVKQEPQMQAAAVKREPLVQAVAVKQEPQMQAAVKQEPVEYPMQLKSEPGDSSVQIKTEQHVKAEPE